MDIFVVGKGEKSVAPDKIMISATIFAKSTCKVDPYQRYGKDLTKEEEDCRTEATELGIQKATMFMENVVDKMEIDRTTVTTSRFYINSNQIDLSKDYREHKYVFDNCTYTQYFNFEFDYNKHRLAQLMELFAQNASFASCDINFGLKKETHKKFVDDVIQSAYKDAYAQALSIAKSAGFEKVVCAAASHESFTNNRLTSSANYRSSDMALMECSVKKSKGIAEQFVDVFNPSDITVSKTIYYHFKGKSTY